MTVIQNLYSVTILMIKNWEGNIAQSLEGSSTGGDHFRHIYSFIECLHSGLLKDNDIKKVNYDTRERFNISNEDYPLYVQKIGDMIYNIQSQLAENIVVESSVYGAMQAISTVKRELQILLEHDDIHHTYFSDSQPLLDTMQIQYIIQENSNLFAEQDLTVLNQHIQESLSKYNEIKNTISLSESIVQVFEHMTRSYNLLQNIPTNIYVYRIVKDKKTRTSVARELYYIEEMLIHYLYDIRLYLKHNHTAFYNELLSKDPYFGISHSTQQHILHS